MEEMQDKCEALILTQLAIQPRSLRSLRYVCLKQIKGINVEQINTILIDLVASNTIKLRTQDLRFLLTY